MHRFIDRNSSSFLTDLFLIKPMSPSVFVCSHTDLATTRISTSCAHLEKQSTDIPSSEKTIDVSPVFSNVLLRDCSFKQSNTSYRYLPFSVPHWFLLVHITRKRIYLVHVCARRPVWIVSKFIIHHLIITSSYLT